MRFGEPPEVASLSLKNLECTKDGGLPFSIKLTIFKENKLATAMIILRRDSGRSATFPRGG